jgi:hypothetical protein
MENEVQKGKVDDTHRYRGWLNSDHFWRRAVANVGYNFVGGLIIGLVIFVVFAVLAAVVGLSAWLM